jgi:purine-binding chemotaxis protein CheW
MSSTSEAQFVTFSLSEQTFAVPVENVQEILDHEAISTIPNGPDYFLGLRDVRGRAVPTIDMRLKLGLPKAEPTFNTRVLVMDVPIDGHVLTLGVVADKVSEVTSFRPDQFEGAPDLGVRWRSEYIAGIAHTPKGFVVIIDVARLFSSEDTAILAA